MPRAIRLDLTGLLLWGGALVLFLTFRSPFAAAKPLAAAERAALDVVRALAATPARAEALASPNDAVRARLRAELHARCEAAGVPRAEWPEPAPETAADRIVLQSADWLFMLAASPHLPGAPPAEPEVAEYEAWAWPRHDEASLRTVFCVRSGHTVTTRNLTQRYLGARRAPHPGGAAPRPREAAPEYWGVDGQFWRPHPD